MTHPSLIQSSTNQTRPHSHEMNMHNNQHHNVFDINRLYNADTIKNARNTLKNQKIAVLGGGYSSEHEISLKSAKACLSALTSLGYDAILMDPCDDVAQKILAIQPALCFNALHGTGGEDGQIQSLLDRFNIPYTHSNALSSLLGINKYLTKELLKTSTIPDLNILPSFQSFMKDIPSKLHDQSAFDFPIIAKELGQGSSIGIHIFKTMDDWQTFHDKNGDNVQHIIYMVEPFIDGGTELTSAFLFDDAYAVTEIVTDRGFYDYTAKYNNVDGSYHVIPARIHPDVAAHIQHLSKACHHAMQCHQLSRCDFIMQDPRGLVDLEICKKSLYLLEINTHPGLTPASFVPEQAAYAGLDFDQLVELCVLDIWIQKKLTTQKKQRQNG